MSNIRRKTAEHLSIAWQAPHVTQHDKADMTGLEEVPSSVRSARGEGRRQADGHGRAHQGGRGALDRYPAVRLLGGHGRTRRSLIKKYRHIGVAVDTPNGLLVPVIRDADRKTMTEIAVELAELVAESARQEAESRGDVGRRVHHQQSGRASAARRSRRSSTSPRSRFSVSRAGPSSRCGRTISSCRARCCRLSLSYDHRVIDGADAARFLRFIAEALEQPMTMVV